MTSVRNVKVMDLTGVKSAGVQAVALLALSLGWNVLVKPGQPITCIAKDGTRVRMPTNTTIKAGTFQGYLSSVMTHSVEFTPTVELMDHIIKIVKKLNQDEERRLRLAVGEDAKTHRERVAAMEAEIPDTRDDDGLKQRIELPSEWVATVVEKPDVAETHQSMAVVDAKPEDVGPRLLKSGPVMTVAFSGQPSRPHALAIRQEWSDGTVTFKCKMCSYVSNNLNSFTGHGKAHGGTTERTKREQALREAGRKALAEAAPTPADLATLDSLQAATDIIDQIRDLVGVGESEELQLLKTENDQLIAENAKLLDQNASLVKENQKLLGDWEALYELIGKKS